MSLWSGLARSACYTDGSSWLSQVWAFLDLMCFMPIYIGILIHGVMRMSDRRILGIVLSAAMLLIPACASNNSASGSDSEQSSGLRLPSLPNPFGRNSADVSDEGIGVNGYLWRASLDTISFMPLANIDPFGGVIITDWYANPQMTTERFKLTVYILDTRLRADALAVSVFRQVRDEHGGWIDSAVSTDTHIEIENAILTRARQLRIAQLD